ncbi:rhomboid family intramembrane serine protease [Vaginisenegalia massiliensis]|uniref:rhomboid family intramembrane serine protease n=1 Tax=Vaginisenegalia massiliensis TaxID=2058294 RepID=UPI0013DE763B|nr:rhomboid family intramembrane serine protease [Vaginisenegalia massiliensis]
MVRNLSYRWRYWRRKFNDNLTITNALILIMVLMFLVTLIRFGTTENGEALVAMGARFNPLMIAYHEWWRLVSAIFLHIGFEHLAINVFTLYFLGQELDYTVGWIKYLIIFFISGMGGNLASFAFSSNISAGASTALFGCFAAFLVLGFIYPESSRLKQRSYTFGVLLVINIIVGLFSPGLDNWGHLGGAVFGAVTTYLICQPKYDEGKSKWLKQGLSLLVLIGLSLVLLSKGYGIF